MLRVGLLAMVAGMLSACSDDEKTYLADVYFTKPQSTVTVVPAAGTPAPLNGSSAMDVCFDAAGAWTIAAKEGNTDTTADWVRFYTTSGQAGSQLVGIYPTANTTGQDRFATIQVACNGRTISCMIVQPATNVVENPNLASIDANKTITKAAATYYGESGGVSIYKFSYTSGVLSAVNDMAVELEGRTGDSKMLCPNKMTYDYQVYAIANGMIVKGFGMKNVDIDMGGLDYNLTYSGNHLTGIEGISLGTYLYKWDGDNLTSTSLENVSGGDAQLTYGTELNDCNLDINWIIARIALEGFRDNVAHIMNLTGERCRNLVSTFQYGSYPKYTVTYTDGVTDTTGSYKGLTATVTADGQPSVLWQFYFE
jgi:hypothetical protein